MTVRCLDCARVAMSYASGLPVEMLGMGLCSANRPEGVMCVHVGLEPQRECASFAQALPEVVAAHEQVLQRQQQRETLKSHMAMLRTMRTAEERRAYLQSVGEVAGEEMRSQLEAAYTADWNARRKTAEAAAA